MRTGALLIFSLAALCAAACKPKTTLPQTDPATWAHGGWQQLRWGMGPGDVELSLRELKGDLAELQIETLPEFEKVDRASADSRWVELPGSLVLVGRACTLRLGFYRGALFHVGLSSRFPGLGKDGKLQASAEPFLRKEREAWRDNVLSLLTEKYGKPAKLEPGDWWSATWASGPTTIAIVAADAFLMDTGERTIDVYFEHAERATLARGVNPADKNKL